MSITSPWKGILDAIIFDFTQRSSLLLFGLSSLPPDDLSHAKKAKKRNCVSWRTLFAQPPVADFSSLQSKVRARSCP
jgi:hypothetical protein